MNRSIAIVSLAACRLAGAAQADLLTVDWQTAGDGLLTLDTSTGLYWLDWTVATNLSRDTMEVELQAGGSFGGMGFRYASVAELHALCGAAGAPDVDGRTAANVPAVTGMLSQMGANNFYNFLGAGNSSAAHVGASGIFGILTIETFDNPVTAKAGQLGGTVTHVPGLGHALVTTVPTPGAAAVLGLAGLGAMRRRR